jgi:hypothetical protein
MDLQPSEPEFWPALQSTSSGSLGSADRGLQPI